MNREERRKATIIQKDLDANIQDFIRQSNLIEDIDSVDECTQSTKAWLFLVDQKELTHDVICKVQKMITINQTNLKPNERGYYRGMGGNKTNVSVGGRNAPDASMVESLMQNWLFSLNEMTPLIAHIRFEGIHPFVDGNGRTGRMVYWWHCKQLGHNPYFHTAKQRKKYYRLFDHDRMIKLSNNNWGIAFDGIPKEEESKES